MQGEEFSELADSKDRKTGKRWTGHWVPASLYSDETAVVLRRYRHYSFAFQWDADQLVCYTKAILSVSFQQSHLLITTFHCPIEGPLPWFFQLEKMSLPPFYEKNYHSFVLILYMEQYILPSIRSLPFPILDATNLTEIKYRQAQITN